MPLVHTCHRAEFGDFIPGFHDRANLFTGKFALLQGIGYFRGTFRAPPVRGLAFHRLQFRPSYLVMVLSSMRAAEHGAPVYTLFRYDTGSRAVGRSRRYGDAVSLGAQKGGELL